MSFFEELKRRNVIRVSVAYLVAFWLLMQMVDVMSPIFDLPDWAPRLIFLILAVGFVPVAIFSWAFELTPEGIKRESEVNRSESITNLTAKKLDYITIGLVVGVVLLIIVDRFMPGAEPRPESAVVEVVAETSTGGEEQDSTASTEKSIAVLPFINMSDDAGNEYFSDGISEEILNSLAKVKELKVAGRTSSFAFKGKEQDLRDIGQALGVEHILEGSVRKAGNKVRITAQLIQVDDGFHLWSETYDRELDDVFVIQDEIATAILEQLKAALIGSESQPVVIATARTDSEVYNQYLIARQRIYERKRFSIEAAVELLDKAIAKDPAYAPAYAQRAIAELLLSEYNYGETKQAEAESRAKLYIDKALELNPELAEGWAALGLYHTNRPGEHLDAIETLEKALAINPSLIDASNWLQIAYGSTGDNAKALEILVDMVELDPLYPPGFANAINLYNMFGRQEKSWELIERIRPYLPGDPQILQSEANTWMTLGKPSRAVPLLEAALETQPNDAVMRQFFGWGLLSTGQFERAAETAHPWHKAIALSRLGRNEEAMMIAREQAANGEVSTLIRQFSSQGDNAALIEFVNSHWPDLDAFEREYPDGGTGASDLLAIAAAYSALGNEQGFDDAMSRIRKSHDHSNEQGIRASWYLKDEARYYALAGDRERAVEWLSQALDEGWMMAVRPEEVWPEMTVLAGDPDYEAVLSRMQENVSAERAGLGLEPLNT